MSTMNAIRRRRKEIIEEMATLERIRRGSVTDQMLHPKGKDGRRYDCGPYAVYTIKRGGRTISRRVRDTQRDTYKQQVDACHRFQALARELMDLGEQMCDLSECDDAEKKTPHT